MSTNRQKSTSLQLEPTADIFDEIVINEQMHKSESTGNNDKSIKTKEFIQHRTVIKVDATNNAYFYLFPTNFALWWYYKVVLTKYLPIIVFITLILCSILNWYFHKVPIWDVVFEIVAWTVIIFASWCYNLSLNFDIMFLVFKTFDFWYKLSNAIIVMIATGYFCFFCQNSTGFV